MAEVTSSAVSVILPVLNEEHYLEHAVRAILAQDYQGDLEVVLQLAHQKIALWQLPRKLFKKIQE